MTQGSRRVAFFSPEALNNARERLKQLAQVRNANGTIPKKITRPRLIRELRSEITAALKKGYEFEDILAILNQDGIDIHEGAFREYWRLAKRRKSLSETRE